MAVKEVRLLDASEIECRVGTISEKGLSLLLYKDARADMKILDETYGSMNWQRSHEMIGGSLYCTVSIWDDEKHQWVSKMDVGTESYTEKEKGQASDSFKRACVSIGIGRELYTAPFIWIPASNANIQKRGDKYCTYDKFTVRQISYNEKREICGLVITNQDGKVVYRREPGKGAKDVSGGMSPVGQELPAGAAKVREINKELARTGVALDVVLERYGVGSIGEMDDTTYRRALSSLRKSKTKAA